MLWIYYSITYRSCICITVLLTNDIAVLYFCLQMVQYYCTIVVLTQFDRLDGISQHVLISVCMFKQCPRDIQELV